MIGIAKIIWVILSTACLLVGLKSANSEAAQARKLAFHSPLPDKIGIVNCRSELLREIEKLGGLGIWTEQAPGATGARTYRSPTKHFGRWLELTVLQNDRPSLYEVTLGSTIELTFDSRCVSKSSLGPGLDFGRTHPDSIADWFDDKKLKSLIRSSKPGIIYVWSPGMVYSAKFLKSFRDTAKAMNVEFTPIVDPRSKGLDMLTAAKEYGFAPIRAKLNSVELYMRNPTTHYPSTMVYKNGKIHSMPIVGVMPTREIEDEVNRRLHDLDSSRTE